MRIDLDYDDQCDLAYGRVKGLFGEIVMPSKAQVASVMAGLGLSGEQADMVVQRVKAERALLDDAWTLIANAGYWDMPERSEWRDAAERWRDRWILTLGEANE